MQDSQIVDLFFERDERAIDAVAQKYGRYCYTIAYNILKSKEDADESVNDTYLSAWKRIPPHRPTVLSTYLGKITRRISINKWKNKTREKRGGSEVILVLEELSECLPSRENTEKYYEQKELCKAICCFLDGLSEIERDIFVSRYWFLAGIKELGEKFGFSESKIKSMLYRIRGKMKKYLSEEGLI